MIRPQECQRATNSELSGEDVDKGYQGAGGTVRTPFKRHATRPRLSGGQKAVNRAHARIRALGERASRYSG